MKRFIAAMALSVAMATAAFAADLKGNAPSDFPLLSALEGIKPATWSGLYFGIVGGPDFVNTKTGASASGEDCVSDNSCVDASVSASLDGFGATGVFGEAQVGYDHQFGNWVVGAYGGLGLSNAKTSFDASFTYDDETRSMSAELRRDWHWLAGLRAGYLVNNTLIYVSGGYTQADFSLRADGDKIGSDTFGGWFGEAGFETRLTHNIYGRVAGRYTAYDKQSYDAGPLAVTADPEDLRAMVGIAIKLNTR